MSQAESLGGSGFARFINSAAGRVGRIVAGLGLICWGVLSQAGSARLVLVVIGLVPLVAGVFNLCLISALLGGPISGSRVGAMGKPRS
jgi:hypothetical protein